MQMHFRLAAILAASKKLDVQALVFGPRLEFRTTRERAHIDLVGKVYGDLSPVLNWVRRFLDLNAFPKNPRCRVSMSNIGTVIRMASAKRYCHRPEQLSDTVLAHGEEFVTPVLAGITAILAVEFGQRGGNGITQRGDSRGRIAMGPANGLLHHGVDDL